MCTQKAFRISNQCSYAAAYRKAVDFFVKTREMTEVERDHLLTQMPSEEVFMIHVERLQKAGHTICAESIMAKLRSHPVTLTD
ncbi:hypothetical protein J4N45_10655 [Vibrio sp. SCSIO 43140]|uniref:hypothetical protein n=1 Tax=Vibrio sp. SCSIO 43140 TaxID=2819100 RepID=UPI0020752085|nr:hypothetical protein [Vibrio sp. SCSIO 43140]USD58991.1 hypothetical protein J4N45_10655 [Vibrio sp. SCSIO 43140]